MLLGRVVMTSVDYEEKGIERLRIAFRDKVYSRAKSDIHNYIIIMKGVG